MEGKSRVLHVVSALDSGGVEKLLVNIYREIDRQKLSFHFLSLDENAHTCDDEITGLGGSIFYTKSIGRVGPIKFMLNVYRLIKSNGPYSVVHSHLHHHNALVLLAAKLARVKIRVSHSHCTEYHITGLKKFLYNLAFRTLRLLNRRVSTMFLACSRDAGTALFGKAVISKDRFHVFANAISIENYKAINMNNVNRIRREILGDSDGLIIGHIGRFAYQKNHVKVISIGKKLAAMEPSIRLVLIGEGELEEQMKELVEAEGLSENILFLGVQTNIHEWMRAFDVFMLPSVFEGLGIVNIEAQAAGTPCVISHNVPQEVDLGLGLINYVDLNAEDGIWAEKILECASNSRPSQDKIQKYITNNGYNLVNSAESLEMLYGVKG